MEFRLVSYLEHSLLTIIFQFPGKIDKSTINLTKISKIIQIIELHENLVGTLQRMSLYFNQWTSQSLVVDRIPTLPSAEIFSHKSIEISAM